MTDGTTPAAVAESTAGSNHGEASGTPSPLTPPTASSAGSVVMGADTVKFLDSRNGIRVRVSDDADFSSDDDDSDFDTGLSAMGAQSIKSTQGAPSSPGASVMTAESTPAAVAESTAGSDNGEASGTSSPSIPPTGASAGSVMAPPTAASAGSVPAQDVGRNLFRLLLFWNGPAVLKVMNLCLLSLSSGARVTSVGEKYPRSN